MAKQLLSIMENIKDGTGLECFLKLAADLSYGELEQLVDVGFVFHKERNLAQGLFIMQLIQLPKHELFSILNCFAQIFTRLPNLELKRADIVLYALKTLSPAQHQSVTEFCLDQLPAELFNNAELLNLYTKAINHLPEGEYQQILKEVYPYLKNLNVEPELCRRSIIEKEFCRLLDLLIKMPSSERKDVLEKMLKLFAGKIFKWGAIGEIFKGDTIRELSLVDTITFISQVPFDQRSEVIHYAAQFYKGNEHHHTIQAIHAIKDALANGKKYLLDIALDFGKKIGQNSCSYNLINILSPLPEKELRSMTQNADLQSLLINFNYRRVEENLSYLVKFFANGQEEILPFIARVFKNLDGINSDTPLTSLFNKLLSIPSFEQPRIVKLIPPLLCRNINCDDIIRLIDTLLPVSQTNQEDIVQRVSGFTPVLSLKHVIAVIKELAPLTPPQRNSVCSYLDLFLIPLNKENTEIIKNIVNAIMALPEIDRDDVIHIAIELRKAKALFTRHSTLKSLASLSSEGRHLLTTYAPRLGVSGKYMDNYIEGLANLSLKEQEVWHAQVLTLSEKITKAILRDIWEKILEILAKLTAKERYIVLQHPSLQEWINEDKLLPILKILANKEILGFASCSEILDIFTNLQQTNPVRFKRKISHGKGDYCGSPL